MMDTGPYDNQDAMVEDTVMDMGHAPVATNAPSVPEQPAHVPHIEQGVSLPAATSSASSGMDVDSHMEAAPVSYTTEQEQAHAVPSFAQQTSEHTITDTDSPMNNSDIAMAAAAVGASATAPKTEDILDAVIAGAATNMDGYESSDLESSDNDEAPESSDSDSDSDSDMDAMPHKKLTREEREKALIAFDAMNEDEEPTPSTILHTANEILQLPEVKRPDIVLGPEAKLELMGTVMSIVDNVVVVQAAQSGEVRVLDSGTIAAIQGPMNEEGVQTSEVLGEIFDTFGPVARPLYSIRFNTAAEIPGSCTMGTAVYAVPEHSSIVMTGPLKALKGSDASNKFDEEVDDVELEFSDDEKEMMHKKMLKMAKNKNKGKKGRKVPGMAADTTAALQAMNGEAPAPTFTPRQPIALPARPKFDEPEDGYRILQRPGVAARGSNVPSSSATTGTLPWYQQQQRELQTMMGGTPQQQTQQQHQQHQAQHQQPQQSSNYMQELQQQQHQHQQLLQQQRLQHQQIQAQQAQQQALYQQQIQKAQETIQRLQQQQQQLQQQQQQFHTSQQTTATPAAAISTPPSQAFSFTSEQQMPTAPAMHPAYNPMQAQYQPQAGFHPQQPQQQQQQQQQQQPSQANPQQIMNMLSPLFPQQQHQQPQ